jgi:hypothetical protein
LSAVTTPTAATATAASARFACFCSLAGLRIGFGHARLNGGVGRQSARHVELGLHRLARLLGRASRLTPTPRLFSPGRRLLGSTGIDDFGGGEIVIELRCPRLRCAGRTIAIASVGATTTGFAALLSGLAFANLPRLTRLSGLTTFARFAIFTRRPAFAGLTRLTTVTSTAIASAAFTASLAAVTCC